jgi:hypothetical protein
VQGTTHHVFPSYIAVQRVAVSGTGNVMTTMCCPLEPQDGKEAVQESWFSMHRQAMLVAFALAVFAFLLSYPIFKVRC